MTETHLPFVPARSVCSPKEKFVFVSRMTRWDPATGKIERGTIARQTELMLKDVNKVLAPA